MPLLPLLLLFLQADPATIKHSVTNIFKPYATPAETEANLAYLIFAITGAIFLIVAFLTAYAIWKFRQRPEDDAKQEPAQIYGSNQIELAWTVIPVLIVFILIGVTARVVAGVQDAPQPSSATQVRLIGHQWWWEVQYPQYGFVTANEIHVPVASGPRQSPTYFQLESKDVIHSFWIPQLSGKTDLIPNRANTLWIDPREPGTYLGNCAEYCGTQHANMLLRVIVHPKGEFEQWANAQKRNAVEDASAERGRTTFQSLACVSCHTVQGTPSKGKFGPDLTHLMSRQTIAAGVLENTPANLRSWIDDPNEVKPGSQMPSMKLTAHELDQVVAYLETLK